MARAGGKDRGLFEKEKGSGVWWIRYHDHRGKERREKVGPKAAARQLYEDRKTLVRQVLKGLRPESDLTGEKPSKVTLGEYIASSLPELQQKKSWKDEKRYAETWSHLIGGLYLDEVAPTHAVLRRTALLERGLSPATANRETEFLRATLNRAVRDGLLERNPLHALKLLPVDNVRFRTASGGEEERLRAEMEPEDFEIIVFAVDTGIRRERIFSLPWAQVDLENGWITITQAKAGSSRQVPMTNRVRAILERRWASRTCEWVFPNSRGNPLNPETWCSRKFRPALERAGIEGLWFHDLRRTFASKLARKGKGGRVLSGLLGQRSSKTTDRYAHLDPESFQAAISTLNEESTGAQKSQVTGTKTGTNGETEIEHPTT